MSSSESRWANRVVQALLKTGSKCQALQFPWQSRVLQALLEAGSKCQALNVVLQSRVLRGHHMSCSEVRLASCCMMVSSDGTVLSLALHPLGMASPIACMYDPLSPVPLSTEGAFGFVQSLD